MQQLDEVQDGIFSKLASVGLISKTGTTRLSALIEVSSQSGKDLKLHRVMKFNVIDLLE
ncbi:MAG: hypothetical protein ACR2OA_06790 [Rubripirellula sp.]